MLRRGEIKLLPTIITTDIGAEPSPSIRSSRRSRTADPRRRRSARLVDPPVTLIRPGRKANHRKCGVTASI
ncbi:hypothetical protein BN903_74 [Halorubrum sp. AJ67]|nr:hypothetical protein BN903_74 [Halorubrum sp. AJ67]